MRRRVRRVQRQATTAPSSLAPVVRLRDMGALVAEAQKELGGGNRASRTGSQKFTHTTSFDHAVELATNGWPEGAARVRRLAKELRLKMPMQPMQSTYYDIAGSYVDVGRYLEGEPECMVDFREEPTKRHTFRVGFNVCVNGGVDAREIEANGAALCVLIDRLESIGVRVEVTAFDQCAPVCVLATTVKECDQPLDLDRVTFALAHPSFLRRLGFGWRDGRPVEERNAMHAWDFGSGKPSGYGGHETYQGRYGQWTDEIVPAQHECDLMLRAEDIAGDPIAWIKGMLKKVAPEALEATP